MATGMSVYLANQLLDAVHNADAFSVVSTFLKLHVGDPGAAGTSNPAGETTRKAVSWGAAASGAVENDAAITWTGYSTSEDPTHWTLWDTVGPAGGNFLESGTFVTPPLVAGDTLTVAVGALDMAATVAS